MERNRMNDTVQKIKTAHQKVLKALQGSLNHAKVAGKNLAQVSANMPGKNFKTWVEKEFSFSVETAYAYIRIHKNWAEVKDEENYTRALKALRTSRKPKEAPVVPVLTPWQHKVADRMKQFSIRGNLDNAILFLESFGVKESMAA